jgi:hypothetical protein
MSVSAVADSVLLCVFVCVVSEVWWGPSFYVKTYEKTQYGYNFESVATKRRKNNEKYVYSRVNLQGNINSVSKEVE